MDLAVGAPLFDSGQTDEGKVFVFPGSAGGPAASASWTAESNEEGARLGWSVAWAGDVNGDGYSDLAAGAPMADAKGVPDSGRIFVFPGSASGLTSTPWTADGDQEAAQFGWSVASAGDINGDGFADVTAGAPYYDAPDLDEGRAYLHLGSPTGLASIAAWTAEGDQEGAQYGYSVAGAGDVNGDGSRT
jgi:hypothetical protein